MDSDTGASDSSFTSHSSTNTHDREYPHPHLTNALDAEPSFDLERVQTSTPRKGGGRGPGGRGGGSIGASRRREGWTSEESDAGRESGEEGEALHASDTESVDFDVQHQTRHRAEGNSYPSDGRLRRVAERKLTSRSLLELGGARGTFSPTVNGLAEKARGGLANGAHYVPSPSTGSSTLVDEDYTLQQHQRTAGEKTITLRGVDEREEEGELEGEGTVRAPAREDEDESSSSPHRQRRRKSRAIGDLASYVDAKMSASFSSQHSPSAHSPTTTTPRRSPSSRRTLPPATPAAPGAYPPTPARPLSASSRRSPPSVTAAGQIHDAFSRLITGPNGALSHAQERRTGLSASQQQREQQYGFVPTSSLPVERRSSRRERDQDREDERDADEAGPSKLEQALRQLREAQRAEGADRSAVEFAMRSFAAASAAELQVEEGEMGIEQEAERSNPLLPHAARRSFRRSRHEQQQHSVRFASPPPPAPRSPSFSSSRSASPLPSSSSHRLPPPASPARARSTTPDALPPLPPPILPESPEPQRVRPSGSFLRRSSALIRAREEEEQAALARAELQQQPDEQHLQRPEKAAKSPKRTRTTSSSGETAPLAQAPPAQPVFAPSSAYTSASSSRHPPTLQIAKGDEADLSLPHLVSQLSSAVKALTQQQTSPSPASSPARLASSSARLNPQGLPSPPRENADGLRKEFERRRKESDRRRTELQAELEGVEARGSSDSKTRQALLEQLADTYSTEQELGFKVDELRRSIEEMGVVVGGEVAAAVGETLKQDGRTRAKWLAWVFGTQLLLFLLFLRLANQHTASLFPTLYHDPFSPPALFHLPPLSLRHSSEALASLAPTPSLADESVAIRLWSNGWRALLRTLPFSAASGPPAARSGWAVVPS
ncbi:hypothetical protein JCM11251_006734 [Rhodosporidiobolus azoricus]